MRQFLLAALAIVTLNSTLSDAQIFRRRAARRAAPVAVAPQEQCPGGICPAPGAGGYLSVNQNEGFEGQLPDSYFEQGQQPAANLFSPQQSYQPTFPTAPIAQQLPTVTYAPQQMAIEAPSIPAVVSTPMLIAAQPQAAPPVVAEGEERSIVTKRTPEPYQRASGKRTESLLEAVSQNMANMQAAVDHLLAESKAEAESQGSDEAMDAIDNLPVIRVTVVARDGSDDKQSEIDVAQLVRSRLGVE